MANRTFIDLSSEIDALQGFYSSFARRYESIKDSLTAAEVDPKIKEAILAAAWNAKSWYSLNGHLLNTDPLTVNDIPEDSVEVAQIAINQLQNIDSKLANVSQVLSEAQNHPTNFWGFETGVNEWQEDIYEQLRLIDQIFGNNVLDSRATQLALEQLVEINEKIDQLLDRITNFDLPMNLSFTKSSENIDYDKVVVTLIMIGKNGQLTGKQKETIIDEVGSFNNLSKIQLPELEEGQYLLKVENRNKAVILSSQLSDDGWYEMRLQSSPTNLIGWYVDGKYPVIEFEKKDRNSYRINLGNIPPTEFKGLYITENYIDPISLVVDVSENQVKRIYDFFYGSFIDEFVERKPNGNKVYYRKIRDTEGNYIAIYEMELDYENVLENGMPLIKYKRLDE